MLITTEFICAFEAYSLLTAFLDCISSFAKILHTSICPFLAASLMDFFTFNSSVWMPAEGRGGRRRERKEGMEGGEGRREREEEAGKREAGEGECPFTSL